VGARLQSGAMSHAHTADGASIDYFAAGEGPALVLVHGITESRRSWDPVVAPLLSAGYRVVAVDLRGHGDSSATPPYDLRTMAGDIAAVIEAEECTDPLLVGHSLGGAVVSAAATVVGCRGVVSVDQPLRLGGFKASLAELEPSLRGSPDELERAVGAVFESMAGPLPLPERRRIEYLRRPRQDVVLGIWGLVLDSDAAELDEVVDRLAEQIHVPYLALHGIDPGPGYAEWLGERIAGSSVEIWPDHGHYPHLVDPRRFVDRIVAFDAAPAAPSSSTA
jgi:pimeloyl-ACP methyl ester carboxylesterase